ncbi:MAG: hypothetical protein ACYCVN_04680 [Acidimicrobiales bacterium]
MPVRGLLMGYVVAGYVIVLSVVFCYGTQLMWRRHRLERAVSNVVASDHEATGHRDEERATRGGGAR